MTEPIRTAAATVEACRLCGANALRSILDVGATPACERVLTRAQLDEPEITYPLHLKVCLKCWLVQVPPTLAPEETFFEYAPLSSYVTSGAGDADASAAAASGRFELHPESFVVEVAGSAEAGPLDRGVRIKSTLLDAETGATIRAEHGPADLVAANDVYAHVPDIVGFTKGLRALLADDGWVCIDVHHLLSLVENNEYDIIYHGRYQYYTLATATRALATGGLAVVDVEWFEDPHGLLRIWARPHEAPEIRPSPMPARVLEREEAAGLVELGGYAEFAERVAAMRRDMLRFLIDAAEVGETVVGYGAECRGTTLLHHCGVGPELLRYTVDRDPHKHGTFTPGTHIPILPTASIAETRPDYVLVLPWHLRAEIEVQLSYIREWGGRLAFPLPALDVVGAE